MIPAYDLAYDLAYKLVYDLAYDPSMVVGSWIVNYDRNTFIVQATGLASK